MSNKQQRMYLKQSRVLNHTFGPLEAEDAKDRIEVLIKQVIQYLIIYPRTSVNARLLLDLMALSDPTLTASIRRLDQFTDIELKTLLKADDNKIKTMLFIKKALENEIPSKTGN